MIHIDSESPAWMQNLDRFIFTNSMILLHGNTHDSLIFETDGTSSTDPARRSWDFRSLPDFLLRFLAENPGYPVVGMLDPLSSLSFADEEGMRKQYQELAKARGFSGAATAPRAWNNPADMAAGIEELAAVMENPSTPCAFIIRDASRLLGSSSHLDDLRLRMFTRLKRAWAGGVELSPGAGKRKLRSILILLCDHLGDLPAFVYQNSPQSRTIEVTTPERKQREYFLSKCYDAFPGVPQGAQPERALFDDFSDATGGFSFHDLRNLIPLAQKENAGAPLSLAGDSARRDLKRLISTFEHGSLTDGWSGIDERLRGAEALIRERVKGQKCAVQRTLDVIKGTSFGVEAGGSGALRRPRGVLFFAGPTGVGKTELAKALAEAVFGDDKRLVRFDMTEYQARHSDHRLFGAPPGYVGHEAGGQLTNAVQRQPCSILLFDEVEKAHGDVLLNFLQILDDGRITDGRGEPAYFSQSILVFTSNLGIAAPKVPVDQDGRQVDLDGRPVDQYGRPVDLDGPVDRSWNRERVHEVIKRRIRHFFVTEKGRPELFNRFGDNFVVFDFIDEDLAGEILEKLLKDFKKAHWNRNRLKIELSESALAELKKLLVADRVLRDGGRGIRSMVEAVLVRPLHRELFDRGIRENASITVTALEPVGRGGDYDYTVQLDTNASQRSDSGRTQGEKQPWTSI